MNKFISTIKSFFPLVLTICAFIVILVQLPMFIIQSLITLIYCFSIVIFLIKFFHRKENVYIFPKLIVIFSVFTCCVSLSSIRTFLIIKKFDDQLFLIRNIGLFLCKENYVCGFFTTILLIGVILYFSKIHILLNSEKAARTSLSDMSSKIWEINNKEINGEITKTEADSQKALINIEINYYSSYVGASKYLINTLWAFIGLFIVVTAGGFAVGILELNLSWHEALNQYIVLSAGYLVVFAIPMFIVSVSFGIK